MNSPILNVKYRNIRMVNDEKDNPTISVLQIKENFRFNSYKLYEKEMDLSILPPVKRFQVMFYVLKMHPFFYVFSSISSWSFLFLPEASIRYTRHNDMRSCRKLSCFFAFENTQWRKVKQIRYTRHNDMQSSFQAQWTNICNS